MRSGFWVLYDKNSQRRNTGVRYSFSIILQLLITASYYLPISLWQKSTISSRFSVYMSLCNRKLTNRGFMSGPFCPIYGVGATLGYILLHPFAHNIVAFFMPVIFFQFIRKSPWHKQPRTLIQLIKINYIYAF